MYMITRSMHAIFYAVPVIIARLHLVLTWGLVMIPGPI